MCHTLHVPRFGNVSQPEHGKSAKLQVPKTNVTMQGGPAGLSPNSKPAAVAAQLLL